MIFANSCDVVAVGYDSSHNRTSRFQRWYVDGVNAGQESTTGGSSDQDIGCADGIATVGAGMPFPVFGLGGTGGGVGRKRSSANWPRDFPVSLQCAFDLNGPDTGLSNVGADDSGIGNPGGVMGCVNVGNVVDLGNRAKVAWSCASCRVSSIC